MDEKSTNFVPLKRVKIEENINDYYNNNSEYCDGNKKNINFVGKNEIKCKDKCLDIVEKWIARVVVKVPTGNNWHNIIAREIALLKVRYPFLPEQQLRGKALMKFGIPSMCGNIVRTGAGKITGAIARELSQRNTGKKTRKPVAFKVLNKNIIPCINKFERKPKTNMWIQENQGVTNLYNRGRTFTGEIVEQKRTMEMPMKIKNYWRRLSDNFIEENSVSGLVLSPSANNEININNTHEQINCSTLMPMQEESFIASRPKTLLPRFNNTENILNQNRNIDESKKKIKYEAISPESQRYLRMINNDLKENIRDENNSVMFKRKSTKTSLLTKFNDSDDKILIKNNNTDQSKRRINLVPFSLENSLYLQQLGNDSKENNCIDVECLTTEKEQFKVNTISPESLEFLKRIQSVSNSQGISDDNIDEIIRQGPIDCSLKTNPKAFLENMEMNSGSTGIHSDHTNYTKHRKLFPTTYGKKYRNPNFINNCDSEISLLSGFALHQPQSYSSARRPSHAVKRHCIDLTDTPPSPLKIPKHNYDHQYHRTLPKDSAIYNKIHQFYTSQIISNENMDEFPSSQLSLPNISQLPLKENSNFQNHLFNKEFGNLGIMKKDNESEISTLHSYTKSSIQWEPSLKQSPFRYSSLSATRSINGISKNSWEKMTSEDFDYPNNELPSQESRTTCTLTPDINEIFTEINVPVTSAFENVSTQVSIDLLDRQCIYPSMHSSINGPIMNINPEIFSMTYNDLQKHIEYRRETFFMVSDFCSEYDKDLKALENFNLNNKKTTLECISMVEIKIGINKALEILEFTDSDKQKKNTPNL